MEDKIYSILADIAPFEEITDNTDLIESGILDSLQLVLLINEISEQFDVSIPEDDVTPENFKSVSAIVRLLSQIQS